MGDKQGPLLHLALHVCVVTTHTVHLQTATADSLNNTVVLDLEQLAR
jgi:hypothetical protein